MAALQWAQLISGTVNSVLCKPFILFSLSSLGYS